MNGNKSRLTFSSEQLSLCAALLFISYSFIRELFSLIGVDVNITGIAIIVVEYGVLALSLFLNKSKAFRVSCVVVLCIAILLIFNQVFYPAYGNTIAKGLSLQRGVIVIIFLCGISKEVNWIKCISWAGYCSAFQVVFNLIEYFRNGGYWISYLDGKIRYSSYNMDVGYSAAFAVVIFLTQYLKDRKVYKLVLSAVLVGISLIFGSRGCLLVYAFYGLFVMLHTKRSNKKTIMILIVSVALIFLFMVGIDNVIISLAGFVEKLGFKSRTLTSLVASFSPAGIDSSGRDEMWDILLMRIGEKPVLGYGIFGDQYIFLTEYGENIFAHNFILELLISYGIPLGVTLLVILIYQVSITNRCLKGKEIGYYFGALVSYNLGNLLFSNTYWYSTYFWFLIAVIIWAKYDWD